MKSQPVFQPVLVKEEGGDGVFMSSVRSPVLGVTGHADHEAKRACRGRLTSEHAAGCV